MNILFVINNLITGGAERMLTDTLLHLDRENLQVDLVLLSKKETFLKEQLHQAGQINLIELQHQSPYNLLGVWELNRILKNKTYDLIHVHLLPSLYYVRLAMVLTQSHSKLIYTEHCPIVKKRQNLLFRYIDLWCYRGISKVLCVSQAVKESVISHLKTKDTFKYVVLNNALNLSRYQNAQPALRKNYGLEDNDFICLQVSSFRPAKDHKTLLKAFKDTPKRFKLLLAGNGPLLSETRSLCAKMDLNDRVIFLKEQSEIASLYAMTSVVILSSHYEGFGLAVLEGMAAGKPVLATNVGGLKDLIASEQYLFAPGDANTLRKLLLKLESDSEFYTQASENGLEKAQHYDIKIRNNSLLKIYHGLVN
ncbi:MULTISPECIES: glycosyltransferase [unclassified Leeuwenhoekiella]|uniref:glycosyltransferase n=1 Tax=unclassified Leeuwenhoekiella TaxID=2615029 RepID=UPI000C66E6A9|nr:MULTISPECIES: glycosyltransferase [unclassified Leeuwenhoekiella]MBA80002.1 hypothetical protein [Leeuwenhoekiella sp.]|tara:strand:- start:3394 stop:4488 length:1095 start_codon:yes stop_codon:yes gene_type:complete